METKLNVRLLAHTPDPERLIAAAAKLCYSSSDVEQIMDNMTTSEVEAFIARLAKMGHESPFEHINFTFGIEGISRALSHQLVRHRIASFSQQSQRYVKESQFDYIIPVEIFKTGTVSIFEEAMQIAQKHYDLLVSVMMAEFLVSWLEKNMPDAFMNYIYARNSSDFSFYDWYKENINLMPSNIYNAHEKIAIENARYVLPNACETKIVATMNARSLYNFFSVRCCNRAQHEIRILAIEMYKLVKSVAPNVFKYAGPDCFVNQCGEASMSCGKSTEVKQFFSEL